MNTEKNIKMTIVFDNNKYNSSLETGWGFSCFVKGLEKTILFDTGSDGRILLSNMEKLNIDPKEIDVIFISHDHWDHTGGLEKLLQINPNVQIFILDAFSKETKTKIENFQVSLINLKLSKEIFEGVYSTGELGTGIKEQSLVIKSNNGLIVITGCAHPGIVNILEEVKNIFKEKIHLVVGGFHLKDFSKSDIEEIIMKVKKFGAIKVAPTHCSGDLARDLFKANFKNNFIEIGAGSEIEI